MVGGGGWKVDLGGLAYIYNDLHSAPGVCYMVMSK
jgi:hypothetical protein